jgi:alanyl aminopeptidase
VVTGATAEVPLGATTCPQWTWPNADGVGHYRVSLSPAMVVQATGYGWSRMTPQERLVLASDLSAMIQAGDVDFGVGMSLVPRLMREGNRAALQSAAGFASQRQLVPAARMAAYDRWIVKTFGAEARKLGWLRKPGEPLDVDRRRGVLVPMVAEAGDRKLRAEAVKLARNWKELDREVRGRILHAAVGADGATFDRLLEAALVEQGRTIRGTLQHALTGTRDPARVTKVLELLINDRVDVREVMWLPYSFGREPERAQVEVWIRAHLAQLADRIPAERVTSGGATAYAGIFASACDPARRDELASFITEQFGKAPGAAREVAQTIEGMDQCIAYRTRMGPQVSAWAATLR